MDVNRTLTVFISTHNRAALLERTLRYLNEAHPPRDWRVEILVVANACSDRTHGALQNYLETAAAPAVPPLGGPLPLQWLAEPTPGKSHALNRAIPLLKSELVAFVDDDHRVDTAYLANICKASGAYPDADILCGRIIPDWDGTEPSWVHDNGPYRIYPLPVPRYDLGDKPLPSPHEKAIPGGGNLVLRTALFAKVGDFSTDYGPVGHNLSGGEDQEWVKRAIAAGARLQYVPDIVQYHYVDPLRLKLGYLVRKAFERSASVVRLSDDPVNPRFIPPYMIRKVGQHVLASIVSANRQTRRFHLVRAAASLGEIKGHLQARRDRRGRATGIRK
jgi:glycosyltransferase involved in cell wall biosynthesis